MKILLLRLVGAVLALLGLAAVIVGGWFLAAIGTSGTATFSADPGERVLVLGPDVLNRVDAPITITAEGSGTIWAGTARPSDAQALLDEGKRAQGTGVSVRDWRLTTDTVGAGKAVNARGLDIWTASKTGPAKVAVTIDQDRAPQTLVITAPEGESIDKVTFKVAEDRWGRTALGLVVAGSFAVLIGIFVIIRAGKWAGKRSPDDHGRHSRNEVTQ